MAGSTLGGAISLLISHQYKVYILKGDGLYEFDYDHYGEYFGYSNFVALAPEYMYGEFVNWVKGKA